MSVDAERLRDALTALLDVVGEDSFCCCEECEKERPLRDQVIRDARAVTATPEPEGRHSSATGAGFLGGTWNPPGELYETVVAYSLPDARMAVIGVTVHDGTGPHGSRACTPAELGELASRLNGAAVPAPGQEG